jgi:diguanylate cyclase (GGDEF)-like protein
MSIITALLGAFSVRDLEHEGTLVEQTFDRSLMSINYAQAASADFNGLQAAIARRALQTDPKVKAQIDQTIADLENTMDDDLSVAVERAQSDRAVAVGKDVQRALSQWKAAQSVLDHGGDASKAWSKIDRQDVKVSQALDLLVNYTAGDGFTYRQNARATIMNEKRLNMAATGSAIFFSGWIAWLLSRRVVLPIKKASEIAEKIADGDLGVVVPSGNADELGALLSAMETMRGNIKASMEREVSLRQSAQMRLADALDSSCEGIVVVDASDRIVLANAEASVLLDLIEMPLVAGDPAERVMTLLARKSYNESFDLSATWEVQLAEGRWLRVSQSETREGGHIFVYSDISLFKAQQDALKVANEWLDSALANLSYGLCLFDSTGSLRVVNQRFCELLAAPPDAVRPGMSANQLLELDHNQMAGDLPIDIARARIADRLVSREAWNGFVARKNGTTLAVSHRPLHGGCWLVTLEDVTERLQAAEKIAYMAHHDALTSLPNRAAFVERIELAMRGVDRGEPFALLCLDLDHFKEVNDTLGHPIGDQLLKTVAERLIACVRGSDLVARLGGDEFAIIQMKTATPGEAGALAIRVIEALNAPFEIEGNPTPIGVSIGIAMAPTDGRSYDKLLKSADLALYRAKADGRNGFRFFERSMDERQQARRLIELELRDALARDQFELDYQPVYDVANDRISGFEALIRWRHPERGIVAPSDFIPIAEEMGLIMPIGEWVLRRACRDAMQWPGEISVAVNVSAAQLRHGALHDAVVRALVASGLPPQRLVLEITETVLIAHAQNALLVLNRFKAMGIRIAMDDFGTGYSSLSYLRSFPFDNVKIDKSFIFDIATRPEAAAIVRAVIALCDSLGMRTIAEGVENEAQLAFLKAEGCHEAQGFFFSRPIMAEAVPALLATQETIASFFSSTRAA